jgi:Fe-S cluster assembly protein SufD
MPLPSEAEEVWRYSPIDRLDLADFEPVGVPTAAGPVGDRRADFRAGLLADLAHTGAVVEVHDGRVVSVTRGSLPDAVTISAVSDRPDGPQLLGAVLTGGDALVQLNAAFSPDAVVLDVPPDVVVSDPVVIVQWCTGQSGAGPGPAIFPRTVVRVGRGAEASVVEVLAGAAGDARALVIPVSELTVDDGARLSHLSVQLLGTGAWHLARQAARVGRDATLRAFAAGLGADYDRCRTDVVVDGQGGSSELRSAYFGTGHQVHDIRTLQDHAAPRTTSDLLCRGAVTGSSRSVYSGLIRIRKGAVRAQAMQTNNNLVLDESAHADSVPNLDIEENDVRCSHASTVGPIDDDQRWYLESRGVPPARAEHLIVAGFFDDIVDRCPVPAARTRLRREFSTRLTGDLTTGGTRA